MLDYTNKKFVDLRDWNDLVMDTYHKPYNLQQQDGSKQRGIESLTIPDYSEDWELEMNESLGESEEETGVKFNSWLKRDYSKDLDYNPTETWKVDLFWQRDFYPHLNTVANDLFEKGLIEAGDYIINIDW